jgi:hypothetical protein
VGSIRGRWGGIISSSLFTLSTSLAQTHRLKIYCKCSYVIGITVLMDSFTPDIKMRSSAKSIPEERKRNASIRTIRLRKRARMMALIGSDDEVEEHDTEGSVIDVDQGGKEPEMIHLCVSDESVSTST